MAAQIVTRLRVGIEWSANNPGPPSIIGEDGTRLGIDWGDESVGDVFTTTAKTVLSAVVSPGLTIDLTDGIPSLPSGAPFDAERVYALWLRADAANTHGVTVAFASETYILTAGHVRLVVFGEAGVPITAPANMTLTAASGTQLVEIAVVVRGEAA